MHYLEWSKNFKAYPHPVMSYTAGKFTPKKNTQQINLNAASKKNTETTFSPHTYHLGLIWVVTMQI